MLLSSREKDTRESLEHDFEQHINWMQSLIQDNYIGMNNSSSINNNNNNRNEFNPNDFLFSIQAPSELNMPRMSDIYREYISGPPNQMGFHNESCDPPEDNSKITCEPSPLILNLSSNDKQYRISEIIDDEYKDDCEEYYIEDADEIRGQQIPDWARAASLSSSLRAQQKVDPEKIFGHFHKTIDLTKMFETGKKRYAKTRGDSGWWDKDGLTFTEEIKYKRAVGLIAA